MASKACYEIRDDYRRKPAWTYLEAAEYTGFSVQSLRNLVSQGKVDRACRRGAFIVDALSLQKYLKGE